MKGICRLCDNEKELRESHVIPSFVYKWLKNSSGSGFLRFGIEPNKRVQDGYKFYWLCDDCEGLLNEWETEFANSIFHPTLSGDASKVGYGPWLLKFCVSVSWRVLNLFMEEHDLSHYPENLQACAKNAFNVWKEFLLDKQPHPNKHEQHIIPLDAIESYTGGEMPANINRYILRTVDIDTVWGGNSAFVYSKLERFVILGFIEMPKPRQWEGSKVHVKHGVVGPKNYTIPAQFGEYFMGKAKRMSEVQAKISDKQNEKITDTFKKNIDKLANSESFRAMENDVRLFGDKAFRKDSEDSK